MEKLKDYAKKILKNTRLTLALIVLFGLVLRLAFFSGMGVSDSLTYSELANRIDRGIGLENGVLTLATRLGIIYVTSLSYKLFGVNDFSSVFFVLMASVAGIVLVFHFGKLLFNENAGLMAAFLLSFFPLDVVYATKLLSDLPSAFFVSLAVYIFLYSEMKSKRSYLYFLSGALVGLAYLIRESALLIALFFIAYVIYKRQIKKEYFLVALGFVVVFLFELFMLYKLTGDPFFRYTRVQDYILEAFAKDDYYGRLKMPQGLLHYPYAILTDSLISYFYILIFVAMYYFIKNRNKNAYALMFWFIPILLYFSFGSASFTHYLPFKAEPRYLALIAMPGILLLSCFLTNYGLVKKNMVPHLLAILLLLSVASVYMRNDRNVLAGLRELHSYLEKSNFNEVFIDERSMRALNYISRFEGKLNIKAYPADISRLKNTYIVANRDMISKLKAINFIFPKEVENPPKNWKVIKEIGEEDKKIVVYQVQ